MPPVVECASPAQVQDDPELLELMMEDMKSAPSEFQPTNYWAVYEKRFLPELKRLGLHDFRRRQNSVLSSFGATDPPPSFGVDLRRTPLSHIFRRLPGWPQRFFPKLNLLFNRLFPSSNPYGVSGRDLQDFAFEFCRLMGESAGAKPIEEIGASLVGNPKYYSETRGQTYTMNFLNFYLRYVFCSRFVNFEEVRTLVDLGSGSGRQVEVLKKLYPGMCFLLFDLPPQLYVCEQYLSAVFPDSVVSYRETRGMQDLSNLDEGKIYVFGNWKFPLLRQVEIDLFWNSASFQEMEPPVVRNYLELVNEQAKSVFLMEALEGKETASRPGSAGVLKPTTLSVYQESLSRFRLEAVEPAWTPLGRLDFRGYSDTVWLRQ